MSATPSSSRRLPHSLGRSRTMMTPSSQPPMPRTPPTSSSRYNQYPQAIKDLIGQYNVHAYSDSNQICSRAISLRQTARSCR